MQVKMFDWTKIRELGNCAGYIRSIGTPVERDEGDGKIRFRHPPWRPESDSKGFVAGKDGWHDYAKNEKGSIIDACAKAEFDGDIWQAQERLGEMLGLEPTKEVAKEKKKIVATYDYFDLGGKLRHQTVRFSPKEFAQRQPSDIDPNEYIWSLKGIEPILYRMIDWIDKPWVCVVAGEKDADNLLGLGIYATTNPMGEGNWRKEYNEHFAGKKVVVIPDNDETGEKYAAEVRQALFGVASEVRIVRPPNVQEKGDISDWLALPSIKALSDRGKQEALFELIKKVAPESDATIPEEKAEEDNASAAKKANREPFSNYHIVEYEYPSGTKEVKEPYHINELVDEIFLRFWSFPRRIGGVLFDHDRKSDEIRYISSPVELFTWIQEKSHQPVKWGRIEGAVTQEQLYYAVLANATRYEMISSVPSWPHREDVYYTFREIPEATKDRRHFNKFCSFFCPASEADALLLRVFAASPVYFRRKVDRPLWIIDSSEGPGVGKTKLAEMVAALYGGNDPEASEPFWFSAKDLDDQTAERGERRLLSSSGRKKKMVVIDNVTGVFRCPRLARWLTQGSLSGLPPYGRGEETRPNDLSYVITANSATIDRDLIDRGFFLELMRHPSDRERWETEVMEYIEKHRLEIFADIMAILNDGFTEKARFRKTTRNGQWEREILLPVLGSLDNLSLIFKQNKHRQQTSDSDLEDAETIREKFIEQIRECRLNPETDCVWIRSEALRDWAQLAIPGFGGKTGRASTHLLRNMAKSGMIPELSAEPRVYPHSGKSRRRGMMWNPAAYVNAVKANETTAGIVNIISEKGAVLDF